MKIVKYIISFMVLVLIGVVISYADIKDNKEYSVMIDSFNDINADFKFYNVKSDTIIDYDISKSELMTIFLELINNLGLEESDIKWDTKWNTTEKQIFAQVKNDNRSVSIAGIKKNSKETYIIIDIFENKVYKNIVDIYDIMEYTLYKYSSEVNIYSCIAGEYSKKLQLSKSNDIFNKILYNMNAEEIDRVEEENFISLTAYSKLLKDNYLEYLGDKINLNIGLRYSEDEEKTLIYIATPIIKLDY